MSGFNCLTILDHTRDEDITETGVLGAMLRKHSRWSVHDSNGSVVVEYLGFDQVNRSSITIKEEDLRRLIRSLQEVLDFKETI